jgi:thiamine transport system ATP-binding protein
MGARAARAFLQWQDVDRRYGSTVALDSVRLELAEGNILAVMGPSGCGKTTLLRVTAGLEQPDGGGVLCRGEDLAGTPAHRRGFGMVFQDYGLFPHLDVAGNVAFGLRASGMPRAEREERVRQVLRLVRLEGFGRRKVAGLSGGEQQRVALARSLAPSPRLLMLDEPLAALDAALRGTLLSELAGIIRQVGVTAIYVTHDRKEALSVCDRAAVMRSGGVVQSGTPRQLVDRPADSFVAEFLELGAVLQASPVRRAGRPFLETPAGLLPAAGVEGDDPADGAAVKLLVRPRAILFGSRAGLARVRGRVLSRVPHPLGTALRVELGDAGGDGGGFGGGSGSAGPVVEVIAAADEPCPAAGPCSAWIDMKLCRVVKAAPSG